MLSEHTIDKVLNLAKDLCDKGYKLTTKPDTPLALLCNSSSPFIDGIVPNVAEHPEISTEDLTDVVVKEYSEVSDNLSHNGELKAISDQIRKAVEVHLSFVHNTVLANVKEYSEYMLKEKEGFEGNPTTDFNIKQIAIPVLLANPLFTDELDKVAGLSYLEPNGVCKYDTKGPEELQAIIATGNNNVDADIQKWLLTNNGIKALVNNWLNYFSDIVTGDNTPQVINAIECPECGIDNAIAIYLLARGVKHNKPEGSGLDDNALDRLMTEYMEVTAIRILNIMKQHVSQAQQDIVVITYDYPNKTVVVNKPKYVEWLNSGGKNEVLLGALLGHMRLTTKHQLIEGTEKALKEWYNYYSAATTKYKNDLMNRFLTALSSKFFSMLNTRDEIEAERFKNPEHVDTVAAKFKEELSGVSFSDMECIDYTCLRLMTKARYYYTPAFTILDTIKTITEENPDMDVKDAAMVATINYVTDYVADQIVLIKGM